MSLFRRLAEARNTISRIETQLGRLEGQISRLEGQVTQVENQVTGVGSQVSTLISAQEAQAYVQTSLLEAVQHLTDVQQSLIPRVVEGKSTSSQVEQSPHSEASVSDSPTPPLETSNTTLPVEIRLAQGILPFLSNTHVIDVGACQGAFAIPLLKQGYHVTAIEPNPEHKDLWESLTATYPELTYLPLGISSVSGSGELHPVKFSTEGNPFVENPVAFSTISPHPLPEGLTYGDRETIQLDSLTALVEKDLIPPNPGILKIDAEGQDGAVIESLGSTVHPEVIFAEFWSEDLPLWGNHCTNSLDQLISQAHENECYWYFTICSRWGTADVSLDTVSESLPPQSWGSAVFFRNFEVFRKSYRAAKRILLTV
ncbi:MAG: hypothetical protein CMO55_09935 [Verrucomicrobiales bacterium]|nr:hypothetical protein [Verrucomicrobiales bacterium]